MTISRADWEDYIRRLSRVSEKAAKAMRDYMAGSLIVMEAGGCVTDYSGSADFTRGNSVVATNGIIQQDILNAIADLT